jgi:hypothetical protein
MKFSESDLNKRIGELKMPEIAELLYEAGYRQTSSRYAVLTNERNAMDILTDCGPALVKRVRQIERTNQGQTK